MAPPAPDDRSGDFNTPPHAAFRISRWLHRTLLSRPWLVAACLGALWGLARPQVWAGLPLLLGAYLLRYTITQAPLVDWGRGLFASLIWVGLSSGYIHQALIDFGVAMPTAAWIALWALSTLVMSLPWLLTSLAVRRGWSLELAAAMSWLIGTEIQAALCPLPMSPGQLLSGTVVSLWPASVGGVALLSALAVYCGAGLGRAWPTVVLGGWFSIAGILVEFPNAPVDAEIAIIQPNVGPYEGRRASLSEERKTQLIGAITSLQDADLITTPEGAWPDDLPSALASEGLSTLSTPILLGGQTGSPPTNSLFALSKGTLIDRHDKSRLVPLTERAVGPFGRQRYIQGDPPTSLSIAEFSLSAMLCFEDLTPGALRSSVSSDSQLIVASANDGWFFDGPGADWHLGASRLAAATTGRWVVRPTMNGRSAVLDGWGRTQWLTDRPPSQPKGVGPPTTHTASIRLNTRPFHGGHGSLVFAVICLALLIRKRGI